MAPGPKGDLLARRPAPATARHGEEKGARGGKHRFPPRLEEDLEGEIHRATPAEQIDRVVEVDVVARG